MSHIQPTKHLRILSIAPSSKGFGFAVLEGEKTLVNWGFKWMSGNKNNQCLRKVEQMIAHYEPGLMVMEDCLAKNSQRSPRIRELYKRIIELGERRNIRVASFSWEEIKQSFFVKGDGTKYALAELVCRQFPAELGFQLPPKHKDGDSENPQMDIFYAVAVALKHYQSQSKRETGNIILN